MRITSTRRPGYAMMLVLVFIVVFLAVLGVAYRQTAAALRLESVRSQQVRRDEGSVHALARGVTLLETGLPPANPYLCAVTLNTSSGPRTYTVTFTSEGGTNWAVHAAPSAPGENSPPMPSTFAPDTP